MPRITPGNRLYFYQLLSQGLGAGRQVPLSDVEGLFAAHDLDPQDVGCSSVREVLAALGDFVRLTVFKRGRVYVTLLADEAYDGILSRQAGRDASQAGQGMGTWRHRKAAKDPKPTKPRHRHARQPEAQPMAAPVAAPIDLTTEPAPDEAREHAPQPQDADTQAPPGPVAAPRQEPRQAVRAHPTAGTVAQVACASETPPGVAEGLQRDLPQDLLREVFCKDEPLSLLYQLLPGDVEPLAELDEDWRLARATGSFEGTRSSISFVLHRHAEQGGTITAHLRRSVKDHAGKHWALEAVERGDAPSAPDIGRHVPAPIQGLERGLVRHAVIGSWDAYLGELAARAIPEDWSLPGDTEAGGLLGLRAYLAITVHRLQAQGSIVASREGDVMAFDTGLLDADAQPIYDVLVAHEGDIPWQHVGFCTTEAGSAAPLLARLGQVPPPATYLSSLDDVALRADVPLEAPDGLDARALAAALNHARADYRFVAPAWEPTRDGVCLLLPLRTAAGMLQQVLALRLEGEGEGARYVCAGRPTLREAWAYARAVCPERPAWLAGARQA